MLSLLLLVVPARAAIPIDDTPLMKQLARTDASILSDKNDGDDKPRSGYILWSMNQPILGMTATQDVGIFIVTNLYAWGCRLNSDMMELVVERGAGKKSVIRAEYYKKYVTDGCLLNLNQQLPLWAVYDDIPLKIGPGLILGGMSRDDKLRWEVAINEIGKEMLATLRIYDDSVTAVYRLGYKGRSRAPEAIAISQGPVNYVQETGVYRSVINVYASGMYAKSQTSNTIYITSPTVPAGTCTMFEPVALRKHPILGQIEIEDAVAFRGMTCDFSGASKQDFRVIVSVKGEGKDAKIEEIEDEDEDEDEDEECP